MEPGLWWKSPQGRQSRPVVGLGSVGTARRARRAGAYLAAVASLWAAPALGATPPPPVFPHALEPHASEAECADCHTKKVNGRPVASRDACLNCHDEPPAYRPPPAAARFREAKFPHALHADAEECKTCHERTVDGTQKAGERFLEPEQCLACHKDNDIEPGPNDCATCHGVDERKVRPSYHDAAWPKRHGGVLAEFTAAGKAQPHAQRCDACHGAESCMNCHQRRKPLYHARHLSDDRGAECRGCHGDLGPDGYPELNLDTCSDCHEGRVQTSKIQHPGRKLRLPAFPHGRHVRAVSKCETCHAATVEDRQPAGQPLVTQPACDDCHATRKVGLPPTRCVACHGNDRRRQPPASHARRWETRHGLEARRVGDDGPHGERCSLCHVEPTCRTCHTTKRPRNHTGLWRQRLHGLEAQWQREDCRLCHETGSCQRCHATTQPTNHRGAWRATHGLAAQVRDNENCTVCHQPTWCATCHAGGAR